MSFSAPVDGTQRMSPVSASVGASVDDASKTTVAAVSATLAESVVSVDRLPVVSGSAAEVSSAPVVVSSVVSGGGSGSL